METRCVFWKVTRKYCCNYAREPIEDNAPISLTFAITATPGGGAEASSEFRGKMHFARLDGRKYLGQRVMFDTRITRILASLHTHFR
jgi:hypothetical protein